MQSEIIAAKILKNRIKIRVVALICLGISLYVSYCIGKSASFHFRIASSDTSQDKITTNAVRSNHSLKNVHNNLNNIDNQRRCFTLSWNGHNLRELYKKANEALKLNTWKSDELSVQQHRFKDCKRFIALFPFKGRTGNMMFEIASLVGIAHRYDVIPIIPKTLPLNKYFKLPNVIITKQRENMDVVNLYCKHAAVYCNFTQELTTKSNFTIHGLLQSWKYFAHAQNIIRRMFQFKKEYILRARKYLSSLYMNGYEKVCIHVRRGDMLSPIHVRMGYAVGGLDFIEKARNFYLQRYSKVQFIVVSDDKKWCEKNLKDVFVSPLTNIADDLAVMMLCDHVIVTAGTFGWWGAWLSNGTTVYFNGFPRPHSGLASHTNRKDYYPPTWIGIS